MHKPSSTYEPAGTVILSGHQNHSVIGNFSQVKFQWVICSVQQQQGSSSNISWSHSSKDYFKYGSKFVILQKPTEVKSRQTTDERIFTAGKKHHETNGTNTMRTSQLIFYIKMLIV